MSNLIEQYYKYALLTQASYGLFNPNDLSDSLVRSRLKVPGEGDFTTKEAELFTDGATGYSLISHQPNTLEGFSASVFKSNENGEYILSIRGTEMSAAGVITDVGRSDIADIGLNGIAVSQVVDLMNYYQRLTAVAGQPLIQFQYIDGVGGDLTAGSIGYSITTAQVTGELAGKHITVVGHSLGGHLALAMSRLAPDMVDAVYTYNAPGFDLVGNDTSWLFSELAQAQTQALRLAHDVSTGYESSIGTTFNASKFTNLVVSNDVISKIPTVPGGQLIQFDEASNILAAHSIVGMTDSLAVQNLFAKLDSTLTLDQLDGYLKNSANIANTSLEKMLDGLRDILGFTGDTEIGTDNTKRDDLYVKIAELTDSTTYQSLIGHVTLVTPPLSVAEARSDLGLFLSLYYLTPFALKTDGSIAADAQLTIAHPDLATQFKEDKLLTPEQIANGEANFSDMYLADRAAMLSWINKLNKEDFVDPNNGFGYITNAASQHFEDKDTGQIIDINKISNDKRDFIFGSNTNADTLTGHNQNDHLYGMGGADTLNGGKGNDWLEGGTGADTLNGEDGVDQLYGGTDNDTLDGGKEVDYLFGGAGTDTYIHNDGDGNDVIQDSDGQGSIQINTGVILDGGQKVTNSSYVWESADHQTRYTQYDQGDGKYTLNILLANGEKLYVKDWQDGDLGISLQNNTPQDPPPSGTTITDNSDMIFASDANEQIDSGGGNDILIATAREKITLNGGAGDDMILGHGNWYTNTMYDSSNISRVSLAPSSSTDHASNEWRDIQGEWQYDYSAGSEQTYYLASSVNLGSFWKLTGTDSQYGTVSSQINGTHNNLFTYASPFLTPNEEITEILLGGTGNDLISGSYDADYIDGGNDNDVLYGNAGNDFMFGGQGQDFADGGDGSDYIDGGAEKDVLVGGYGADVIHGGIGDDEITGDLLPLGGTNPAAPPASTDFSLMGNDILDGGIGNDRLWGGGGADMLLGGEGDDKLYGDSTGTPAQYEGDDILEGGAGNDEIHGDGGNDSIDGGTGADILWGNAGNDYLDGGAGNDQLLGGAGNDVLIGSGGDTLQGGEDDDTYYIQGGSQIADLEGHSTIYIANARNVSTTTKPIVNPDDQNLNITLDNGEILSIQAALYGMDASLQFAGSEAVDVETLVSTQLTDSVNLFLSSVILASGATVDHAFGGMGNDQIVGDIADDTLKGYAGNDSLFGGDGNDVISGGEGNDHTQGDAGNDVIDGGAGVDEVQGGTGDDLLDGGADDDRLFGQEGSDTLDGGAGNDVLVGNAGDDVYLFNLGGGRDVVWEEGDTAGDVLRFGADIAASDIVVYKSGFDLVLSHVNGLDQITIANWYGSSTYQLKQFEFADGTIWNGVDTGNLGRLRGTAGDDVINGTAQNEMLYGMDGNDTLYGGGGQDTFIGGAGNDRLNGNFGADILLGEAGNDTLVGYGGADMFAGGKGNDNITGSYGYADTYVFALGDGADIINAYDSYSRDTLRFEADILSTDISAERVGNNLVLRHQNGTDSITLSDWYLLNSNSYQLSKVTFAADGVTWSTGTLSTMGTNINHNYALSLGDGAKTIEDWGGNDTLTIGNTIGDADIVISRVGQNLQLAHVNGVDKVTIKDWFNDLNKQIETITFVASGTVLTKEQIAQNFLTLTGTGGDDVIYGSDAYGETIFGMAGNDTVYAGAGDDQVTGDAGNDIVYGAAGKDKITGGAGNDTLYGGDGYDTYYFNQGDGQDTISDTTYNELIFGNGLLSQFNPIWGGSSQDTVFQFGTDSVRIKLGSSVTPKFITNGTAQNDSLTGGTYGDYIYGLGGNDTIVGGSGADWLYGGDGDDILDGSFLTGANDQEAYGSDSADAYVGGKGNDTLNGNSWEDTYYFNLGDGNDVIIEGSFFSNGQWFSSFQDSLIFGKDITLENIQASELNGDLVIKVSATDSVTIKNWFGDYKARVDYIKFDDGRILDTSAIGTLAYTKRGTADDDVLTVNSNGVWGGALYGEAGNDTLNGGSGSDQLHGGSGNDVLNGGSGNDMYYFERGGGQDQIIDSSGTDKVYFDASITAANVNLSRNANDLVLTVNNAGGTLSIKDYFATADNIVESFIFTDGSSLPSTLAIQDSFLNIRGTSADDDLTGTAYIDMMFGADGNDVLRGLGGNDTLYGNAGDDNLDGGAGNNQLSGGDGNDVYVATGGTDSIFDANGDDSIVLAGAIDMTGLGFEKWGDSLNISFANGGSALINNQLLAGPNKVERIEFADGSTLGLLDIQYGNNALTGTAEDSILIGYTSIDMGTNNVLDGGDGNDYLIGGAGNDSLYGGNGNDWLNGGNGSYADAMVGGAGDDIYFVDYRKDVVTEQVNEGTDTVYSSMGYTLSANVENLTLTGTSGINGTGNALDNVIIGNAAGNTLSGGDGNDWLDGKAGVDKMAGGAGDDTYVVEVAGETITERSNNGIDTVLSSVSNTLASNVESLTLTEASHINGTGNSLNNIIIGNSGNNVLNGGAGIDSLIGGAGDDTYIVDTTTDAIIETIDAGIDTVQSIVTFTLVNNVENLTLTGTKAIDGTGNMLSNFLMGNSANNTLTDTDDGNDVMQGLAGIDTFNDTVGNNLFDGGLGNDLFTAGAGNDVIIGGQGNDTITTGTGYDVIVFNKGDGQDIINASTGADNTISLGGNFAYSDLSLTKTGNDLILKMGSTDQITFKDWYVGTTNHSVVNLQVIAEAMAGFNLSGSDVLRDNNVENFNFANIVATFDAAGATANWQLTDTLLTDHLQAGSDSAAIGGDLAYQYGKDSNLTGMGLFNAQSVIGAASFGQVAQALNNPTAWQAEVVKLG